MTSSQQPRLVQTPTTAQQLGAIIKSARDIMRKDKGFSGELDRLPMLTWVLLLKFLDDTEMDLTGNLHSPATAPTVPFVDICSSSVDTFMMPCTEVTRIGQRVY